MAALLIKRVFGWQALPARAQFPLEESRRVHKLLTEGVDVECYADDGVLTAGKVRLLDFEHPQCNDCLAVRQFVAISGRYDNRRPGAVRQWFAAGGDRAEGIGQRRCDLVGASNQLRTYKQQSVALFQTNAVLVTSDGVVVRLGSLAADLERFMPWCTIDGKAVLPRDQSGLPTLIEDLAYAGQR